MLRMADRRLAIAALLLCLASCGDEHPGTSIMEANKGRNSFHHSRSFTTLREELAAVRFQTTDESGLESFIREVRSEPVSAAPEGVRARLDRDAAALFRHLLAADCNSYKSLTDVSARLPRADAREGLTRFAASRGIADHGEFGALICALIASQSEARNKNAPGSTRVIGFSTDQSTIYFQPIAKSLGPTIKSYAIDPNTLPQDPEGHVLKSSATSFDVCGEIDSLLTNHKQVLLADFHAYLLVFREDLPGGPGEVRLPIAAKLYFDADAQKWRPIHVLLRESLPGLAFF